MTRPLICALCVIGASTFAQSPSPESTPDATPDATPAYNGPAKELYELVFDEPQNAFVDPQSREPYTGAIIVTYPGGKPETVGQLLEGQETGVFIEYYEDGTKSSEGSYTAGNEDGPWTYYWENGKIESQGEFRGGSMIGVWKDYFPSGKVASEGEYVDGLAEGPWTITDEFTGKTTKIFYRKGEEVAPPGADSSASPAPSTPEPDATPTAPTE